MKDSLCVREIYGDYSTLKTYASVFANATSIAATRPLNRWKCNLKNGKISKTRKAMLAYSHEIDVELFDLVTIVALYHTSTCILPYC